MASTYSPLLRFELIASGEQPGLWDNTTNSNLGTLVEQAVAGITTIALTSTADRTLSSLSGTPDEARSATLIFTGTPGGTTNIIVPSLQKTYNIRNATNAQLNIKTSTQSPGVAIYPGGALPVYCDGVSVYTSVDKLYYSQMNFLSVNGGANTVPQYDSNGNLGLSNTPSGTWDSGGGLYSLPTNLTGYGSAKPVFAMETPCGAWWTGGSTGFHQGITVNAKWTGGSGGGFKYRQNGAASLFVQTEQTYWWGAAASGSAGAAAQFQMNAYLDAGGNMITRYNLGISDRRVKSDLKPIQDAMHKVRQLVGYTFLMQGGDKRSTGLIAQDVEQVLPEAVLELPDGTKALAYGHLAGLIVNALNELDLRIKVLELRG